ncbi:MAG: efflux RND transporter periplasmic adaptor subunit [Candidatus Cloacimonadota bacterium]|nr:MAG: efflux RND transporter periplasmic adaptor subunit [Candidatus Cloacimonadota bacterium]
MKSKILISVLSALLFLFGCGKPSRGKNFREDLEKIKIPVIVEKVVPRDLEKYIEISGKLEGFTDITMRSEVQGKITEVNKILGDWIAAGEQIGRIDNKDYEIQLKQAEAAVLAAEASYETAQLSLQSAENLFKTKSISQAEFAGAKSAEKNALAGLNAAKAGLEKAKKAFDNSRFIAPVSGYITNLPIKTGETISPGQIVCNIVNSQKLLIKTGVGEEDITKLKNGQKAIIKIKGKQVATGKIRGLGISPLPNSSLYPVEIELENPQGKLFPGTVVEVQILSKKYKNVLFTSLNNILQEYDNYFVFTIDDKNVAVKKKVSLGQKVEENVIIESGLKFGDKLVTEGAESLENGSKVEIRKNL